MASFQYKSDKSVGLAKMLSEFKPDRPLLLSKSDCETWSCAFAPDETYFAWSCGNRMVVLVPWNKSKCCPLSSDSKDDRGNVISRDTITIDCGYVVWAMAFSFSGSMQLSSDRQSPFHSQGNLILATGLSNFRIRVWDVLTGKHLMELLDHTDVIRDLKFAPDDSLRLISASRDKTLKVWDLKDCGNLIKTLKGHNDWVFACAWAPNGRRLASVGSGKKVLIWNMDTYEKVQRFEGHQNDVVACDYSCDSAILATASWDTTVILWDAYTGEILKTLGHVFPPPRMIYASGANGAWVRGVSFSPDGCHIASVADDGYVRIWDMHSDEDPVEVAVLGNSLCCAFSPSGKTLAVGTRSGSVCFYKSPLRMLSLKRLCRLSVCSRTSSTSVGQLEIPALLQTYLRYKDWD